MSWLTLIDVIRKFNGARVAIIKKVRTLVNSNVYKINHPTLPKNTHIVCMSPAQKILYDPIVYGMKLRRHALECSKTFIKIALEMVPGFKKLGSREISEIVVLRGSLGYQFDTVFEQLFDRYLPQCFVGARRFRISGGEFGADIFYTNFDALPDNGVLFTGDTIATGVSLGQTLSVTRSELRERGYDVRKLLVLSIAASFDGCKKLREWEERFREWWPNFNIHLFVAEALFGLADNGTDLLFRHENAAIVPEETKKRVEQLYGDYETGFLPGNMCSIFDWGDRNFKPERHLDDIIMFTKKSMKVAKDARAKKVLEELEENAKLALKKLEQPLIKSRR